MINTLNLYTELSKTLIIRRFTFNFKNILKWQCYYMKYYGPEIVFVFSIKQIFIFCLRKPTKLKLISINNTMTYFLIYPLCISIMTTSMNYRQLKILKDLKLKHCQKCNRFFGFQFLTDEEIQNIKTSVWKGEHIKFSHKFFIIVYFEIHLPE